MHPAQTNKRLEAVCRRKAARARQIADATGQALLLPASYVDLKPNMALPIDMWSLTIAELDDECGRLIAGVLVPVEELYERGRHHSLDHRRW